MVNRVVVVIGLWMVVVFAGGRAMGQTTKPEAPDKLADPAADALQTYLFLQNNNDQAGEKKAINVTVAEKKDYADAVLEYQAKSRDLERQAIAKFGKEDGMRIQGHARTFDDQYKLDLKRIRDANVQYNADKTTATVYLRVELNRPENLQIGDRFNYLDVYEMIKTHDGWRVDFLKTYKYLDPDREEEYQSELAAFPRMAKVCAELCDQVKRGQIKTADDLKNAYDTKWLHVYDEPVRHVLKPGEKPPADAIPEK